MKTIVTIRTNSEHAVHAELLSLFTQKSDSFDTKIPNLLEINSDDKEVSQKYIRRVTDPSHLRAAHDGFYFFVQEGETPLESYKRAKSESLRSEIRLYNLAIEEQIPVSGLSESIDFLKKRLRHLEDTVTIETREAKSIYEIMVDGLFDSSSHKKLVNSINMITKATDLVVFEINTRKIA